MTPKDILADLFAAAVAAADPGLVVHHLPPPPRGRTFVAGAGKAAAAMAQAVERTWRGPLEGIAITRYGHGVACERIAIVEAGHPNPDEPGRLAAAEIMARAQGLGADDLLLCLISGGGSSLLAAPAPGLSFADKQIATRALLRSGAPIAEINCVRKHMSAIKGGRLALAAWPARVVSLIISDVPGDDPAVIASGPTTADPSTIADALEIIERYAIPLSDQAKAAIAGAEETPKPGDPRLALTETKMIATPMMALEASAALAARLGLQVSVVSDRVEGEARLVARDHAALAAGMRGPAIILSGGETSVTMKGAGRGGRNCEFLLALAIALQGRRDVWALAADTDGIDGSEDNAGAFVTPDTLARAGALGLDAQAFLDDNDSYTFFERLGDLLRTGPTRTNVNDFRAIYVGGSDGVR